MSTHETKHYDLEGNVGKTMLLLDNWKSQATLIDNDVIAHTLETPIMTGIENPAGNLKMNGSNFTTIPLYPITQYVNFLYKNYINIKLRMKFELTYTNAPKNLSFKESDYAIYFPSSACIPSRLQLLLGSTPVWTNIYQREESIIALDALPSGIVEKSADFVSLNKLLNGAPIPGFYVKYSMLGDSVKTTITKELNFNIDLNHLCPLLSNIVFTTTNMGQLRLRLFFENLHQGMAWSIIPNIGLTNAAQADLITMIPMNNTYTDGSDNTCTISLTDWEAYDVGVQIVQNTFEVREETKAEVIKYLATDNHLVIPTQTWICNQSVKPTSTSSNGEFVFQNLAYNVNTVAFLFPWFKESSVVFPNPIFKDVSVFYDSKQLNYIPYECPNMRMLKDTTQALINDDYYAANENLIQSVYPGYLEGYNGSNLTSLSGFVGQLKYPYLKMPNLYTIAFQCSPVNTFLKGFSPSSRNPGSTQIRFKYNAADDREALFNTTFIKGPLTKNYYDPTAAPSASTPLCCCLCDCFILLDYNPQSNNIQSGSIMYASPFVI